MTLLATQRILATSIQIEEGMKSIPAIITAAASSNLGLLALMVVALSVLAYVFFKDTGSGIKVGIFIILFGGVIAFGVAMRREVTRLEQAPLSSPISIRNATYAIADQSKRCNSTERVAKICDGLKTCRLTPTNELCGDPQRGTPKYLFVTFSCGDLGQPVAQLREGYEGLIACPDKDTLQK